MSSAGPISGDAARQAAQLQLRRGEYHRDDPGLVSRFLDWLGRRLDSVGSVGLGGTATLVVVGLLLALIAFGVLRAGRPRRTERSRTATDPLAPSSEIDHRRVAEHLQAQGRAAEALREWLRASVASIEQRGVLDPRPGRTGAGIAREAGPMMPSIAEDLDAVVVAFDAVWFGGRPATDRDLRLARQVSAAVRTARIQFSPDAPRPGYAVPR